MTLAVEYPVLEKSHARLTRRPPAGGLLTLIAHYFPLEGPLPRLPPDGLPVVLGQLPPGPGWLDGPRPPDEPRGAEPPEPLREPELPLLIDPPLHRMTHIIPV